MRKILSIAFKSTTAYILAQVLTGIEGGIIAAYFVVYQGLSIPEALAIAIPSTFPLMLIQLIVIYFLIARFWNDKKGSTIKSSHMETIDSSSSIPSD